MRAIFPSGKMECPETGTYQTCLDPALGILEQLFRERRRRGGYSDDRIQTTLLQFRFFKMFFWGLDHWQVSEYDWESRSVVMGRELRQTVEEFQVHTGRVGCLGEFTTWMQCLNQFFTTWMRGLDQLEERIDQLEERIESFKREAREICIDSLRGEISCKPCPHDQELYFEYGRETASFIEFVLENLEVLKSKYHLIAPVKQQIYLITGKLKVFKKFANPVSHSIPGVKNLGELVSQTRAWSNHLSRLACVYWIDGTDESLSSTVGTMLTDLMQKTMPCIPGVIASSLEGTRDPQILASYVDFLLEEMVMPPPKDEIEILREGLIFLLSFMTDPPEKDSEDRELILGQIYSIINELPSLIWSIHSSEMEDKIFETKLSDFLQKSAGVESKVRKLYAFTPSSSQFNYPRTNAMGFLDSLIQELKEWLKGEENFVIGVKHRIRTIWNELASFRLFMQHKDLCNQMINVVYFASYVTRFCSATSISIWYWIICLQNVIEEIKLVRNEVVEIDMLSVEMKSRDTLLPRATTSKVEGAFIGFREETSSIIDLLTRGRKDLTIISISGMPGQGKTTLAKRIYNDHRIQCHFQKTVWCCVSKECKIRDLMIDIVHDVSERDEDISKLDNDDLAEKLWRCLKGRRYLVVMDDIWDVGVWYQVQLSFPNDTIGSRILFTSRNHDLISQNEWNFISYPLRSFSNEESWDLMKEKLYGLGQEFYGLGQEFVDIGEQIATYCKGLPLAVALVGSFLGKIEQNLELWNQVAENLKSHFAIEGCMHIIELSYNYLPDHLKSRFLYFGAFPRGENIRAKRLKLLWIAEGFIQENEARCSEDLAEDCLRYLVSQSLVVVAERSSMGRIKTCNVHDLLYDLCLRKIAEDNFLHLMDGETVRNECSSMPQKYDHHRLCIGESEPFIEARPLCRRMELPTSPVQSLLWLDRSSDSDFDSVILINFLKSFKVLTVLDLEEVKIKSDVFPEVILCNIHLKYLALWGSFEDISPSIAELCNLETLIYLGDIRLSIPDVMWRMKSLRHVKIENGCLSLEDFEGNESSMAAQDNIETLCGVILGDDKRTVEFLGRMTSLRKLKCLLNLHRTRFSIFGTSEKLEELKIQCCFAGIRLDFETCRRFLNLRKLSLEGLRMASWSEMSTIGKHLPNLEVLKLLNLDVMGSRKWDLEDREFSKLRYLKLSELRDLEEINVSGYDNSFPCLEEFVVEYCRSLKEIPSEFGCIYSLNSIKMRRCSPEASESVMSILQQQLDCGNHSIQVFVTYHMVPVRQNRNRRRLYKNLEKDLQMFCRNQEFTDLQKLADALQKPQEFTDLQKLTDAPQLRRLNYN